MKLYFLRSQSSTFNLENCLTITMMWWSFKYFSLVQNSFCERLKTKTKKNIYNEILNILKSNYKLKLLSITHDKVRWKAISIDPNKTICTSSFSCWNRDRMFKCFKHLSPRTFLHFPINKWLFYFPGPWIGLLRSYHNPNFEGSTRNTIKTS